MKAALTTLLATMALSLTACEPSSSSNPVGAAASAPSAAASAPVADASKYASFARAEGGICNLEKLEKHGANFDVEGWAAIDAAHGVVPEDVVVTVVDGGNEDMHIASRTERTDVAEHFKAPGLKSSSGFSVQISEQALKTGDKVVIYLAFQNHLYSCASRTV